MFATLILTRAFAISALLVGTLPVAIAAPVSLSDVVRRSISFDKRFCRPMGCLFEVPTDTTDISTVDSDVEPTNIASDGTEAVFVAEDGDEFVAGTPDVEDIPAYVDSA